MLKSFYFFSLTIIILFTTMLSQADCGIANENKFQESCRWCSKTTHRILASITIKPLKQIFARTILLIAFFATTEPSHALTADRLKYAISLGTYQWISTLVLRVVPSIFKRLYGSLQAKNCTGVLIALASGGALFYSLVPEWNIIKSLYNFLYNVFE